jgi:hypothetical protein
MSNKVKWYDTSLMTGFSFARGDTAGNLLAALDLFLYAGFNTQAVTSITRSGTVATVTTTGAHGFVSDQVIAISGAVESDYNGEFTIFVTSTTTFTYTVANSPTTPATGTISSKAAPLGWNKPYSGTNKAVYRSPNANSSQDYFRINDTSATFTVTRGYLGANASYTGCYMPPIEIYSSMSDVDTGTLESRAWLHRQNTTTAQRMIAVGDDTTVWFAIESAAYGYFQVFGFGDYDPFNTHASVKPSFIAAKTHATANAYSFDTEQPLYAQRPAGSHGLSGGSSMTAGIQYGRGPTGARGVVGVSDSGSRLSWGNPFFYSGARSSSGYYAPGNGMFEVQRNGVPHYCEPAMAMQQWPQPVILGMLPGYWTDRWSHPTLGVLYGSRSLLGTTRKVVKLRMGHSSFDGSITFDITGPWYV